MDVAQIVKSTQEQGFAAWVDYLNQLRLNELLEKLAAQDINLEQALAELQKMKVNIADLIASNRGGGKGMHGFLAEAAETGIENARNLVKGLDAACKWVNDNGPADLLRDGVEIQQKFVRTGGHFGLEAVKEHLKKYPDFINITENIGVTYHGYWKGKEQTSIDFMIVKGNIRYESLEKWTDEENGLYLSDHYPVCAVFSLEEDR